MRTRRPLLPVAQVLDQLIRSYGLEKAMEEQRLIERWPALVGEQIAAHAEAEQLRGERLIVRVDHPAWMQELVLLKPQLLEKLGRACGVTDLVFRLATSERPQPVTPAAAPPALTRPGLLRSAPPVELTPEA